MSIALAVLAVLVVMATPSIQLQAQRRRESELREDLRQIRHALDEYKRAYDDGRVTATKTLGASGYPPDLDVLVKGVADVKDPKGPRIYFLRRLPRDPMATDEQLPDAATWGKRSYASPPDQPEEGADVYDVYSLSERIGLDGRPYRQW